MTNKRCTVGACNYRPVSWGLCSTHYHRLRREMMRNGDWRPTGANFDASTQIACKCVNPKWDTCGPLFPSVHVCRWCGSPHPDEFAQPLPGCVTVPTT